MDAIETAQERSLAVLAGECAGREGKRVLGRTVGERSLPLSGATLSER